MKSRWDAKAEEMRTLFGLEKNEGIYSSKNPYTVASSFGRMPFLLQQCFDAQAGQLDFCSFDLKAFEQILASITLKKNPPLSELNQLDSDINRFMNNSNRGVIGGLSGFGYGYGKETSMYSATLDDLKAWTLEDVKKELQRCVDFYRTQSIWSKTVVAPSDLTEIADLSKKLDEKTFAVSAAYFISAAKGCGKTVDLISGKGDKGASSSDVSGICNPTPEVIPFRWMLFNRDVVAGLLRSDSDEAYTYMTNMMRFEFPDQIRQQVKMLLNPPTTTASAATPTPTPTYEPPKSYCPNRTAEFIEELLKNNPCVRTVYVPDRWLVNRLNEFGSKVMYRPFVEDDRYAVDISKQVCK
ncbi:MAG: hypothetical protein HYW49_03395 [Deltaproteobacteria bacterium]|nr:hypothetical protein [Deltaproteobacteria bacterium]